MNLNLETGELLIEINEKAERRTIGAEDYRR